MEVIDFSQVKPSFELTPEGRKMLEDLENGPYSEEYKGVRAMLDYYSVVKEDRKESWIVEPNSFFKGQSPADMIMAGHGGYVCDMIESTAAGTYF